MSDQCLGQVQACAARIARLEPNGVPDPGANNLLVTNTLMTLTITPEVEAGVEIILPNGCGDLGVNYKEEDRTKRYGANLVLNKPDPFAHELLAGGVVLSDGDARGYAPPRLGEAANPNGVSLELWARRVGSDGDVDPDYPWAWWVFPKMKLRVDTRAFGNSAHESPFVGFCVENPNWHDGPNNDWPEASDKAFQWIPTDSIPDAACGYQTLAAS